MPAQIVGQYPLLKYFPHRIGQGNYRGNIVGDGVEALRGEEHAVEQGRAQAGGLGILHVDGIGGQNRGLLGRIVEILGNLGQRHIALGGG